MQKINSDRQGIEPYHSQGHYNQEAMLMQPVWYTVIVQFFQIVFTLFGHKQKGLKRLSPVLEVK